MTDDEYAIPTSGSVSLSPSVGWGLAGLLFGCTLLVSACVLMVFNVILFDRGLGGVPRDLAQAGGVIGVGGAALLGVLAVGFGYRGWAAAARRDESAALGVAGCAAGAVGLVAWLIAGIDLLAVLGLFA
jgi:hypothetical protein